MLARPAQLAPAALLVLAACNTPGQGTVGESPTLTPTFDAIPLDQALPPTPVRLVPGVCTVGDVDLVGQRVRATLALELDVGDVFGLNRIQAADGRYDFTIQTLSPLSCTPIEGVTIGPLRVDFGFDYQGALADDGGEKCVYASSVTFTDFTVTGLEVLDGAIEAAIQANILESIDRAHAETLNFAPLADGATGRCSDWSPLE